MTNLRLTNLFLAFTDMAMAHPTSYDMVIADLERLMGELPSSLGHWTCVTVNTDHSSGTGSHYNHVTYGIDSRGVPRATFLEPLSSKRRSAHMASALSWPSPLLRPITLPLGSSGMVLLAVIFRVGGSCTARA